MTIEEKRVEEAVQLVDLTIDGQKVTVPAGTLIIRAAERIGVRIPRFCDHPLLKPVAACRQCLVEVARPGRDGVVAKGPKPVPSCAEAVSPGMEVYTQNTSEVARKAQRGMIEFLLVNHPLDCPVCDKGGECPLQNQALSDGRESSRFVDVKRTYPKPVEVSSQILLDRDRCILCQRCTRFQSQIAGDPFIALQGRGGGSPRFEVRSLNGSQIGNFDARVLNFSDSDGGSPEAAASRCVGSRGAPGMAEGFATGPLEPGETDESGRPFSSYFSGNVIQICPVGALTSARYRFRARPVDLVSTDSVTEQDASGSAVRVDMRRGVVLRHLAGNDPEVNEEWITDKDRFAFAWSAQPDRLSVPLVRDDDGELVPTSWSDALDVAATGLAEARSDGGAALLPGARLTLEDAWAWSRFARTVLGTNDIDQRVRDHCAEEDAFLAARVAGTGLGPVTYRSLEGAGRVLLVALEPEDECGALFLRLRKGVRAGGVRVAALAPLVTNGSRKLDAEVVLAAPGREADAVAALTRTHPEIVEALGADGAAILVGERAAAVPGLLTAVAALARTTGARLAWVPRRAGERGGIEAGCLPFLLPGGRPVTDAAARRRVARAWGAEADDLPGAPGRDTAGILAALADGTLSGLVVGGVDLRDFPDPDLARRALNASPFTVQLEVRRTEISEFADVVLPVAPAEEKNGTFVNWEGRVRPFGQARASRARTDRQVLGMLAAEMDVDLGVEDLGALHAGIAELGLYAGQRGGVVPPGPAGGAGGTDAASGVDAEAADAGGADARLATHKPMLDAGRLQDGEAFLASTARRPVARVGADLARRLGLTDGRELTVSTPSGSITLPAVIGEVADGVVWLPECSAGSTVRQTLGTGHGGAVRLSIPATGTEVVR